MNPLEIIILVQIGILTILDVVVPARLTYGLLGLLYWWILWVTLITFSFYALTRVVKTIFMSRLWITLATILLVTGIIIWSAFDPRYLSNESTAEIACIIQHLKNAADSGFSQTCHLGYPARQFYLPAIPTLLFGPSLAALQLGNSIYFFLGFIVFLYGLIETVKSQEQGDVKSGIIIISLMHFSRAVQMIVSYEQSAYPVSFALYLSGLLLLWIRHRTFIFLLIVGLLQFALIHTYTPTLTLLPLIGTWFVYAAYRSFRDRSNRWIIPIALLAVIFVSLFFSVRTRSDIRLIPDGTAPSLIRAASVAKETWNNILFHTGASPWTSSFFTFPFFAILALALTGYLGKVGASLSVWMIGVMFAAVFSTGYADGSIDYKLQRATVIVPFFLILIQRALSRIHLEKTLAVLFSLTLLTGLMTISAIRSQQRDVRQVAIADIIRRLTATESGPGYEKIIHTTPEMLPFAKTDNLHDATQYFLPGWETRHLSPPASCILTPGIWILLATDPCTLRLKADSSGQTIRNLGSYTISAIDNPGVTTDIEFLGVL